MSDCIEDKYSSRVCEKGTKSCKVQHKTSDLVDYAYSLDEENYKDFGSIMGEVNSDYPEGTKIQLSKAETVQYTHDDFIDIDIFFKIINETACDECGEYAEDYMYKVDKEKRDELKKVISAWMNKNFKQPKFFTVKNISKVEVVAGET